MNVINSHPVDLLEDDEILEIIDVQAFEDAKRDMLAYGVKCEEAHFMFIPSPEPRATKSSKDKKNQQATSGIVQSDNEEDLGKETIFRDKAIDDSENSTDKEDLEDKNRSSPAKLKENNESFSKENPSEIEVLVQHCKLSLETCDNQAEGKHWYKKFN